MTTGKEGTQIFKDYRDSLKDHFFDAYGQMPFNENDPHDDLKIVPWVEEKETSFEVNDPHRGKFSLPKSIYKIQDLIKLGLVYSA